MAKGLNLKAVLRLDDKEFQSRLKGIQSSLNSFKSYVGSMFAFTGFATLSKQIISVSKDFESAMARVQAVTNATTDNMRLMTEEARRLGETTRYTATEAANALEMLTRNGVSAVNATKMLSSVLEMAQANVIELKDAANIMTNVINMFGLSAEDASRVNDVMSSTASHAATNITELYQAMTNLAPAANVLGFSIEETSAAIGALAQKGVKGFDAGTQLRMALVKLADPKIIKKMQAMGVAIDEDRMRIEGYLGTVKRLKDAQLSLSDLVTIFSQKGAVGMQQLISSYEDFERLVNITNSSVGTAHRMYNQSIGSVQKELDILKSKWESLLISIGEGTGGAIRGVIVTLQNLIDKFKTVGGSIEVLATVILPLFARKLTDLAKSIKVLFTSVNNSGGWISVIGYAISALAVTIMNLTANMRDANKQIKDAEEGLGQMAANAAKTQQSLNAIKEAIGDGTDFAAINGAIQQAIKLFPEFEQAIVHAANVAASTGGYDVLKQELQDICDLDAKIKSLNASEKLQEALTRKAGTKMFNSGGAFAMFNYDTLNSDIRSQLKSNGFSKTTQLDIFTEAAEIMVKELAGAEDREKAIKSAAQKVVRMYNDYGVERNNFLDDMIDAINAYVNDGFFGKDIFEKPIQVEVKNEASRKEVDSNTFKLYKQLFQDTEKSNNSALSSKSITKDDYSMRMYNAAQSLLRNTGTLRLSDEDRKFLNEMIAKYPAPVASSKGTKPTDGGKKSDKEKVSEILSDYQSKSKGYSQAIKDMGDIDGYWANQIASLNESTLKSLYQFGDLHNILKELGADAQNLVSEMSGNVAMQNLIEDVDKQIEEDEKEFFKQLSKQIEKESDSFIKYLDFEMPTRGTRNSSRDYKKSDSSIAGEEFEIAARYVEALENALKAFLSGEYGEGSAVAETIKRIREELIKAKKEATDSEVKMTIAEYNEYLDELNDKFAKNLCGSIRNVSNAMTNLVDGYKSLKEAMSDEDTSAFERILDYINYIVQAFESTLSVIETIKTAEETLAAIKKAKSREAVIGSMAEAAAAGVATTAKSGEAVAGATASGAKIPFPYNLAAIAAGVAAVMGALAMIKKFATGGIVGGNSTTGDHNLARVNSGEMILNKAQQGNLWNMINGKGGIGGNVQFEIKGSNLVGVLNNYNKKIKG